MAGASSTHTVSAISAVIANPTVSTPGILGPGRPWHEA